MLRVAKTVNDRQWFEFKHLKRRGAGTIVGEGYHSRRGDTEKLGTVTVGTGGIIRNTMVVRSPRPGWISSYYSKLHNDI
jgi:hypothetical protein